jgi:hypothetical protein
VDSPQAFGKKVWGIMFTILWIIGITLVVALWVAAAEIVPPFLGPVYFAVPFVTIILIWLFSRVFKK